MTKNQVIQQIENHVNNMLGKSIAHDIMHVDRVRNWAIKIAKNEGYKYLELVEAAALLHDIGRSDPDKQKDHGEVGALIAEKYLSENHLLSKDKIDEICSAIKYHNKNREGSGKLLDIIRDADMLDLFGAVGIMRAFSSKYLLKPYDIDNIKSTTWQMTAVDFNKRFDKGVGIGKYIIDQINFQISCYDNLTTKTARSFAKPMVEYMKTYIYELENEIKQRNINK